jgi:hypothetical protein
MDQSILISNKDTLLLAIPLLLMVFASAFRLDRIIATPKDSRNRRRTPCGVDQSDVEIFCDPDGRRSDKRRAALPGTERFRRGLRGQPPTRRDPEHGSRVGGHIAECPTLPLNQ